MKKIQRGTRFYIVFRYVGDTETKKGRPKGKKAELDAHDPIAFRTKSEALSYGAQYGAFVLETTFNSDQVTSSRILQDGRGRVK